MPNTRDIKRRIKSVGNIKQITRAMQLVATSKMKRAEEKSREADAYAYGALEILENITKVKNSEIRHPYWIGNNSPKTCLIIFSADRGFCGGLNVNLFNSIASFLKKRTKEEVEVITVGKKGINFARRLGLNIIADFSGLGDHFSIKEITPITHLSTEDYKKEKFGHVFVAFNQFINILVQKPIIRQILPFTLESFCALAEIDQKARKFFIPSNGNNQAKYLFEPSLEFVFEKFIPHLLEIGIYKIILESRASEHSARMVAMKNATDKAGELIDDLHLSYNQARQASITKEIAEISSGAIITI